MRYKVSSIVLSGLLLCSTGCTKSGGSGSERELDNPRAVTTDCGIVVDGSLQNPVSEEDAREGTLTAVFAPSLIEIDGRKLVMLHGVEPDNSKAAQAEAYLSKFLGKSVLYFMPDDECKTDFGSDEAIVATVVDSESMQSLAEGLARKNLVFTGTSRGSNQVCNEGEIASCLSSLADTRRQEEQQASNSSNSDLNFDEFDTSDLDNFISGFSGGGASGKFLWKPQSERNNNLVVLVDDYNARVFANGKEADEYSGSSNGYGTTARFNRPGCSFGANVKVTIKSSRGVEKRTIPNGCNRFQK